MKYFAWLTLALVLFFQQACGATFGEQAALDAEFKLLPHQMVAIKGTGLTVRLDKVLRSWYTDGRGETVSVEITTTLDGKEEKQYLSFKKKTVAVGEFEISLLAADPFGKNECKFKVTRRKH